MSRLRSHRQGRRLGRVLVPVLVGGVLVLSGYFLWSDGERSADAGRDTGVAGSSTALSGSPEGTQSAGGSSVTAEPPEEPPSARDDSTTTTKPAGSTLDQAQAAGAQIGPVKPAPADPTTKPAGRLATGNLLSQASAYQDQGNLLEARKVLNDALQSGALDHAAAEPFKARIRDLNQTIIFTPTRRYADDPQQSAYTVQPGDNLVKVCRNLDVPHAFIARVNAVKPERIRPGQNLKLLKGPIHALVSKRHFTMDLYLGDLPGKPGSMYLTSFKVGLGEAGSTPTGTWEVTKNSKTENPAWTNPRTNEFFERDDPKNPLGERWIGLTGIAGEAVGAVSYGIHGTIEPESIGTNASMGCVRLKEEDVAAVFDMLSEGKSTVKVVE